MQIFRLRRGNTEHGMSSISKEYFAVELGESVLSVETEGIDVVVVIAGKIIKPSNLVLYNDLLKEWRRYYEANRYRFDFQTYILHPKGTAMEVYAEEPPGGLKYRLATDPKNEYQARLKKEIDTTSYLINQRREVLSRSWD